MSLVKAIHHVKLKCTKDTFEAVFHFYAEVLGIQVLAKHEDCAILDTGSGIFEIFNDAEQLHGTGDFAHVAFFVESVDEAVETVEKAGYKIKEYPVNVMFDRGVPTPARLAFCYGPIGEEIEFFQWRES